MSPEIKKIHACPLSQFFLSSRAHILSDVLLLSARDKGGLAAVHGELARVGADASAVPVRVSAPTRARPVRLLRRIVRPGTLNRVRITEKKKYIKIHTNDP